MSNLLHTEQQIRKEISKMFKIHSEILKNETVEKQNFGYYEEDGKLCAYGLIAFRGGIPKKQINSEIEKDHWSPLIPYGLKEEWKPVIKEFFKTRMKTADLNDRRKLSFYEIGCVFERYSKEILDQSQVNEQ